MSGVDAQVGAIVTTPAADPVAMRAAITALTALLPTLGDPDDEAATLHLLRVLHAVGRRDLPLGRLFEGHVDALQIVARYGDDAQVAATHAAARGGAALGVWNADLPGGPALRLAGARLSGGKGFASGAGILSHALVSADSEDGRQLLLLDLSRAPPAIDDGWWRVTGMQRSATHLVRWDDATVPEDARLGRPGDYVREPWFSGGALRFVAVQAGGVAALFDRARDHLVAAGRANDPHQRARLATLFGLADLAAAAVRTAAEARGRDDDARWLPRVAAARLQVADLAERALAVAQQAVGLQGLFVGHPLAATITDLQVYLRQPAPDAQAMRVGEAAADGRLVPTL